MADHYSPSFFVVGPIFIWNQCWIENASFCPVHSIVSSDEYTNMQERKNNLFSNQIQMYFSLIFTRMLAERTDYFLPP